MFWLFVCRSAGPRACAGRLLHLKSFWSGHALKRMTFECNGRVWHTIDLLELNTDDPDVTIYADGARRLVFVGIRERDIGILVHRADDAEIEWVCRRYHLPQLLDYLE